MSLRFILGRAGTGKTDQCLKEIKEELKTPVGPPLIFLVPEQATWQTELALINFEPGAENTLCPGRGLFRAQVLSFRRLAWRVLQEAGGLTRAYISEPGKQMLLRKVLIDQQTQLKVFQRVANQPGFIQALSEMIRELKNYRVNTALLAQVASRVQEKNSFSALANKLNDLALIYTQTEKLLANRYLDPDDYLELLAGKIPVSCFLRASQVWIDGFAGFTPQEYKVIEQLLLVAGRVNVALCLDSRLTGDFGDFIDDPRGESPDIFSPTRECLHKLKRITAQLNIPCEPPLLLDYRKPPRFRHSDSLAYLEEKFFQPVPAPFSGETKEIKVVSAVNPVAEVEGAAREIISLCREKGYRWREISIVLRDLNKYQTLLEAIFGDYKIPFFIDTRREVKHHPLPELIRAALETIARNWPGEEVFRYLKTDLVPVTREEVDLLENYVLAHGIKGSRWYDGKDWQYIRHYTLEEDTVKTDADEEKRLARVNQIRRAAIKSLFRLQKTIQKATTGREMTNSLYELLVELDVPRKLEEWSKAALENGTVEMAREHIQIWSAVVDLFDQLVETLGTEKLSLKDFVQVVTAGLAGIRLGLIPPGLDQVLVGSLTRSRNPNVRACFVLGVNDGVFPARRSPEGVLTDPEREQLETVGVELAPAGRRLTYNEQYLAYIALTRASEYLWVSYPLADEEGKACYPSPLIQKIKKIFKDLPETICTAQPTSNLEQDLEFIAEAGHTLSSLVLSLQEAKNGRSIPPVWWAAYNWLIKSRKCRRVLASLFYVNQEKPLKRELTTSLYGKVLRTSISRLERYHTCKFAYSLAHGLKLKERATYNLQPMELGEFYHACLKAFTEKLRQNKIDWGQLTKEQSRELTGKVMEQITPRLKNEIFLSTARHRFLAGRVKCTLERAIERLSAHARRSIFRPQMVEVAFSPEGQLPPLLLPLSGKSRMELSGRIDRVDLADFQQNRYIRIIDYKSGPAEISLNEIFYGLKLQLLAYLIVIQATEKDVLPAGILYFPVTDPVISQKGPLPLEAAAEEVLREMKMKGFVLADPQVLKLMDSQIAGSSSLLPAGLKSDGSLRANSSALDPSQFATLAAYLKKLFRRTGEEILAGQTLINPYRYKQLSACQYCAYKPVCLFDLLLPENKYRLLTPLPNVEIWRKIEEFLAKKEDFQVKDNG